MYDAKYIFGLRISIHHCLYSPAGSGVGERNPLTHANYSPGVGDPNVDFRYNIVWKWGRNNGSGGKSGINLDGEEYAGTNLITAMTVIMRMEVRHTLQVT